MFERVLFSVIQEGIARMDASPKLLRRLLTIPGWEPAETAKLVDLWGTEKGKPQIFHGYARVGARFPAYAIVLSGEQEDQSYIGESAGLETTVSQAQDLVKEIEDAVGHPVEAAIQRWNFRYEIYTYAEHPEVCLAYYNVLRTIFMGAKRRLLVDGMETPTFSGQDLMPDPRYMPDNLFARQFSVSGFAHLLFTYDLDLGPWALGRAHKIDRVFVDDHVTGVNPGVTPVLAEDIEDE